VIGLARIVLRLFADLAGLVVLSLRPRRSVEAENLFLHRELALYQERVAPSRLAPDLSDRLNRHTTPARAGLLVYCGLQWLHGTAMLAFVADPGVKSR